METPADPVSNPCHVTAHNPFAPGFALDPFPGFYLCFQPTRPTSVGRIDIASGDFHAAPAIAPNYMSTDKDVLDVMHGGRLLQAIARTQAMRALIKESLEPDLCALDAAALVADFRARAATVCINSLHAWRITGPVPR